MGEGSGEAGPEGGAARPSQEAATGLSVAGPLEEETRVATPVDAVWRRRPLIGFEIFAQGPPSCEKLWPRSEFAGRRSKSWAGRSPRGQVTRPTTAPAPSRGMDAGSRPRDFARGSRPREPRVPRGDEEPPLGGERDRQAVRRHGPGQVRSQMPRTITRCTKPDRPLGGEPEEAAAGREHHRAGATRSRAGRRAAQRGGRSAPPKISVEVRLGETLAEAREDPGKDVANWLEHGAPAGFARRVTPGPFFPRVSRERAIAESEVIAAALNHPSFYEAHREDTSPAKQLVLEAVSQGFGQLFKTRADAERVVGPTKAAPLGNVRKLSKEGTGYVQEQGRLGPQVEPRERARGAGGEGRAAFRRRPRP